MYQAMCSALGVEDESTKTSTQYLIPVFEFGLVLGDRPIKR